MNKTIPVPSFSAISNISREMLENNCVKTQRPSVIIGAAAALAAILFSLSSAHGQPTLADALDAPGLVWTAGGSAAWAGETTTTHDGVDAAQSGFVLNNQESWLQTTVDGPGTLTFWWKVSSEQDFDWLRFHLDGVLQAQISGEVNWQQRSLSIPTGSHTLKWRYVKDPGDSGVQDRGWLDQVSFTAASGAPTIATQPASQAVWEGANLTLSVVALGSPPLIHQWLFNDTAMDGATNTTLLLLNVLPSNAGDYRVVVTNDSGSITSTVARLSFTNNGSAIQVLLFVDSPVASPFQTALVNLGQTYQRYFDVSSFISAVNSANRATTLLIIDAPQSLYDFTSVQNFVNGGGRVLFQANQLAGSPSLATALNVSVEGRLNTTLPVYGWGGSPLFTGLGNSVSRVEIGLDEDTQKLNVAPGGYAVGGFAVSPTEGQAAIVIGNAGRTIVNGFWMEGISSSASAVALAENEILFLTGPVSVTTPVIRLQPRSQTVRTGSSATFRAIAWGGLPLNYQWLFNESNAIPAASNATLTLPSAQLTDAGKYQILVSNAYSWVTSSVAILTVTTGAPPADTILLFTDNTRLPSYLASALTDRAQTYQRFTDFSSFSSAIAAAVPATTLVVVDSTEFSYDFSGLISFLNAGGRTLVQYWNLGSDSTLASAFNVTAQSVNSPMPVYDWGGPSFFNGLSSPLSFVPSGFGVYGAALEPTGGGQSEAGYVSNRTANQAAIVTGNSARTIVNGFLLEAAASGADATQLAYNEIEYLIGPPPAGPPVIITQPQSQTVLAGSSVSLNVRVCSRICG